MASAKKYKGKNIDVLFQELHDKAIALGLNGDDFSKIEFLESLRTNKNKSTEKIAKTKKLNKWTLAVIVGVVSILISQLLFNFPVANERLLSFYFNFHGLELDREPCLVDVGELMLDVFRPPVPCEMCEGVTKVDRLSNLTPEEFEKHYAYTSRPVIIADGTKNWTAPKHFSYDFFKSIYPQNSPALENVEMNCQFFPYRTDFKNLGEVLNMSEERAQMKDGSLPWYIGWSNCDISAANILRQHYERPYFLPKTAESSRTDWIFMGSPGYGAHLHIDNVRNPSWQAQITGKKKWTLEPPPECYDICPEKLEVIVMPGDIIVIDTNQWYHSTLNVGDDISITIGSEYD